MRKRLFAQLWAGRTILSNMGQGVLEYILVLVIAVMLMLGMIYQFNTAFAGFLDNFFGSYLACLIETGELPSLGGQSISQGECEALYQPFDLNSGRRLLNDTDSEGQGQQGGGQGGRGRAGGSNSRYGGGGARNAEAGAFNNRPANQVRSGGGGGTEATSAGSSEDSGGIGRRTSRIIRVRPRIPDDFIVRRGLTDRAASRRVTAAKRKGDGDGLRKPAQKYNFTKDPPKFNDNDEGINFNLGDLLKWMVILGILIALVVFVGGQIAQIRKSWEKGE